MVAAVAATASRATATNPVIVRCLVIQNLFLWSLTPLSVGHGNFAKVQQRCDKYGLRECTDRTTKLSQTQRAPGLLCAPFTSGKAGCRQPSGAARREIVASHSVVIARPVVIARLAAVAGASTRQPQQSLGEAGTE